MSLEEIQVFHLTNLNYRLAKAAMNRLCFGSRKVNPEVALTMCGIPFTMKIVKMSKSKKRKGK